MSASVAFTEVMRMLEHCAKGSDVRRTTHGRRVEFNGKVFRDLPKFDNIEIGHIRKMVRHLGIDKECAKSHNVI